MAVSNSFNFTLTRDTLITEALERLGANRLNKTAQADIVASAAVTLNLLVKHLQGRGLMLFSYRDAVLFLKKDAQSYLLGPSVSVNDKCVEGTYYKTTLSASAALGASTITVTTVTGIVTTMYIGIELDSGQIQWTTVNGAPAGSVVTLAAVLTGAATSGNTVYAYATTGQIQRPLEIKDAFLRDASDNDLPLNIISLGEYKGLTPKLNSGPVNTIAYDPQLTDGKLWVWPCSDNVDDRIYFSYKKPLDDFDAAGDNPPVPPDWFEFLVLQLCWKLSPKLKNVAERQYWEIQARTAEMELNDTEDSSISIIPDY